MLDTNQILHALRLISESVCGCGHFQVYNCRSAASALSVEMISSSTICPALGLSAHRSNLIQLSMLNSLDGLVW